MTDALYMSRRLILHDDAPPAEVRAFAERQGWDFHAQVERDPEQSIFYEVLWNAGAGHRIHYVVDEIADAIYFVASHRDDPRAGEHLLDEIQAGLPVYTLEELTHAFDVNIYPAGWSRALVRLGVAAPKTPDDEVLMRIRESIGHRDADVRKAAVRAMCYAEWPELLGDLGTMAEAEGDPDVKRLIEFAVSVLENPGSLGRIRAANP